MEDSQCRKWHIVIHNPQKHGYDRETLISILNSISLKYYCLCEELTENGTPHNHVFIYSRSPKRMSTVMKVFKGAHVEKARGTVTENKLYIEKEGKWKDSEKHHTKIEGTFYEKGEIDEENGGLSEPEEIMDEIREGASLSEIVQGHPKYAMKARNLMELMNVMLADEYAEKVRKVVVTYIHAVEGETGMDIVYRENKMKDVCRITNYNARRGTVFDGYHGQGALVFDGFQGEIPAGTMISYMSNYPLSLPARYGDRTAMYEKMYIVSRYPLKHLYSRGASQRDPLINTFINRVNRMIEITSEGEIREVMVDDEY